MTFANTFPEPPKDTPMTEATLDPVEVMADRAAIKNALRPWADAYHFLERSGYNANPSGTALMYNVKDPRFLGPCTWDLKPLYDLFERMVTEDGGSRL